MEKKPLFEHKYSDALEQTIITRLRPIDETDIRLTHFSATGNYIMAHFEYSQELIDAREWTFEDHFDAKPLMNCINDSVYIKRIDVDYRGCRLPETKLRKEKETADKLLARYNSRAHEILANEMRLVQSHIDRCIIPARDVASGRVNSWLGSRDSFESIKTDETIANLQRQYDEARKAAQEAHEKLVSELNKMALRESAEVLEQLPDDMRDMFIDKLKNNTYFQPKFNLFR